MSIWGSGFYFGMSSLSPDVRDGCLPWSFFGVNYTFSFDYSTMVRP